MWNSSSVPTIRSQAGRIACSLRVTSSDLDEAALALAVAGEAPEVRAVVDVERDLARPALRGRGAAP